MLRHGKYPPALQKSSDGEKLDKLKTPVKYDRRQFNA
jgi:hypothetical protein